MKEFFNSVGDWFLANWKPIVTTLAIIIIGFILVKKGIWLRNIVKNE